MLHTGLSWAIAAQPWEKGARCLCVPGWLCCAAAGAPAASDAPPAMEAAAAASPQRASASSGATASTASANKACQTDTVELGVEWRRRTGTPDGSQTARQADSEAASLRLAGSPVFGIVAPGAGSGRLTSGGMVCWRVPSLLLSSPACIVWADLARCMSTPSQCYPVPWTTSFAVWDVKYRFVYKVGVQQGLRVSLKLSLCWHADRPGSAGMLRQGSNLVVAPTQHSHGAHPGVESGSRGIPTRSVSVAFAIAGDRPPAVLPRLDLLRMGNPGQPDSGRRRPMSAPTGAVHRIPCGSKPLEVGSGGARSSAAAELAGSAPSSGTAEAAAAGEQTGARQEGGSAAAAAGAAAAAWDGQPGAELKGTVQEAHAVLGGDAPGVPAALQEGDIPGGRPPTAVSDVGEEASTPRLGERNAESSQAPCQSTGTCRAPACNESAACR